MRNSKDNDFFTDDVSVTTGTTFADTSTISSDFDIQSSTSIPSLSSDQSSLYSHSFRRLLSTMSTDSLLIAENEEEECLDEFTVYCDRVEKNILSSKKSFTKNDTKNNNLLIPLHQIKNYDDDDETRVCTNTSTNRRRTNFILHRYRR